MGNEPGVAEATLPVDREVIIAAPRELVWACWTDPERLVRWMGKHASIDLRPGGAIRIEYANGAVMVGEVLELNPPARLVFSWGWEDPAEVVRPGGSRVEVDLEARPDGGTRVRVLHLGLPAAEATAHGEGWDYFLGRLGDAAG